MKASAILGALALVLAACGASRVGVPSQSDAPISPGDAANQCSVDIEVSNASPQVGVDESIRATASVLGLTGVVTYDWQVTLDGAPTEADPAAPDDSAVDIPITTAGTLHIGLSIDSAIECPPQPIDVTVLPTTLATRSYRLHVTPLAASGLPAIDEIVLVHGGVDTVVPVALSPGFAFTGGSVVDGSGSGVPAYVRLTPVGAPLSIVEAYASASGALPTLHVLGEQHSALIVPDDATLAPATIAWTPGTASAFAVDGGTTVTGVVRDPSGAGLVGASVALMIGGTPSSVGTTSATGAFTLHAAPIAGATIAITVTPPATSGLPRLVASSATIALDTPWTISYAAGLATRDLSTVHVTRAGSAVASAQVAVVGAIASAGTIVAGATNVSAAGDVEIATTTSAAGLLAGRAPAAALSLVVTRSVSDVSLTAFDLTAGTPASVATAAPVSVTGSIAAPAGSALAGVRIDATGSGPLAGVVVEAVSDGSGAFAVPLAAGGAYTLAVYDPAGRAAPSAQSIAAAAAADLGVLALPAAVGLTGTISVSGASASLAGTAVQLLCAVCTGPAAAIPIAEAAADANGRYRLAVPDPSGP